MRFLMNILRSPPEMPLGDLQRKKGYFSNLLEYYKAKVDFLSKKHVEPHLLKQVCLDSPYVFKTEMSTLEKDLYKKSCLKFYRKKIGEIEKELKKLGEVRIKRM